MRYLTFFVFLFLSCSLNSPDRNVVSSNSQTSACGGFKELSKQIALPDSNTGSEYCKAEKIIYNYSPTESLLKVLHTRIGANCASELEMSVEEIGGKYVIEERDKKDPNLSADCDCVFDTYCEINNVRKQSFILVYNNKDYNLDFSKSTFDTIIINTTTLYQCGL